MEETKVINEVKEEEFVLCLPAGIINSCFSENATITTASLEKILRTPGIPFLASRELSETANSCVQIISYGIVMDSEGRILMYRRNNNGGDERLFDKYSVGFGGHCNMEDCFAASALYAEGDELPYDVCLYREIAEELTVNTDDNNVLSWINSITRVGTVYDTSTEVSKHHLGLVYRCDVKDEFKDKITPRENCLEDLQWVTVEDLNKEEYLSKLEGWSKLIVEAELQRINKVKE